MNKPILVLAAASLLAMSGPVLAQETGASTYAPGQNKDVFTYLYSDTYSPTPSGTDGSNLGQDISGGFYGNTSNQGTGNDGHGVTPSISPGPQVVGGGGPGTGTSLGDEIQCLMATGSPC